MTVECSHCHALHFLDEKLANSSRRNPRFSSCCLQGQVVCPPVQPWPVELQQAFNTPAFICNIRQYNSALAFTSSGVKVDRETVQVTGPSSFRMLGELHHLMGSLLPEGDRQPMYAQLYIYDPDEATNIRAHRNSNLNHTILANLHDMLFNHHPWARVYKKASQVMLEKPAEEQRDVRVDLEYKQGTDGRRFNLPAVEEIAAVVPQQGSNVVSGKRDIVLRLTGGGLRRISQLSPVYLTLHYVLLFAR